MAEDSEDILARTYDAPAPKIDNCTEHARVPITERDIDCPMCSVDMRSMVQAALAANAWLCQWQEDATKVISDLRDELRAAHSYDAIENEDPAPLQSEPDADGDTVSPRTELADGTAVYIDHAPDDLSTLRVGVHRPGDLDPVTYDYIRTVGPSRRSAMLALELVAGFIDVTNEETP
jgi:hypothetical protein